MTTISYTTVSPDASPLADAPPLTYIHVLGQPWPLRRVRRRLILRGRRVPILVDADRRQLLADAAIDADVMWELLMRVDLDRAAREMLGMAHPEEVF